MAFRRFAAVLAVAASLAAWPAFAGPLVKEAVEYYSISGRTGAELLREMNRHGPRHGFLRRAIAQTRYAPDIRGNLVKQDGVCRMKGGRFVLNITYVYPRPSEKLPSDVARRWKAFQADNVRHEKMHGRIAREMAVRLDRVLRTFSYRDRNSHCNMAMLKLERAVDKVVREYNRKQRVFDAKEHRQGGAVEKSIVALLGKRSG